MTTATPSQPTTFDASAFRDFLNHGWLLALDSNRLLVGWGAATASAGPEGACSVYLPDFYLTAAQPWRTAAKWAEMDRDQFARVVLAGAASLVKSEQLSWEEPAREGFAASWKSVQEGFEWRGLKKGVPVVFAKSSADTASLEFRAGRLAHLTKLPRVLYPYGFWNENEGVMGATPELLFSLQGSILETVALAGTRGKGTGPGGRGTSSEDFETASEAETLLKDPKERYEHQLVVEDIQECLSRIGDVSVGHIEILELPTLFHLKTRLQARPSRALEFADLVKLLHPTPALGVSPRALGFEEMKIWDSAERGRFGAPFGVRWPGGVHAVVGIRNVQWNGRAVALGSGCGVVPESQFEREWAELALKRDSVKRMLGL